VTEVTVITASTQADCNVHTGGYKYEGVLMGTLQRFPPKFGATEAGSGCSRLGGLVPNFANPFVVDLFWVL